VNQSRFNKIYSIITNAKQYRENYQANTEEGLDSFDPVMICQAASGQRKVETISAPLFKGKVLTYCAEGNRDHLPYRITVDYTKSLLDPSIRCEVLPF